MAKYITHDQQQRLVSVVDTKLALRQSRRQWFDHPNRHMAKVAQRALTRALKAFDRDSMAAYAGVCPATTDRYMLTLRVRKPLPKTDPAEFDWTGVDEGLQRRKALTPQLRAIGPTYLMAAFGVSEWNATRAPRPRPIDDHLEGMALQKWQRQLLKARAQYKALCKEARKVSDRSLALRYGIMPAQVRSRAQKLRNEGLL